MKETFVLLGTGGSTGIPRVGCKCHVCTSKNRANKRLRSQGLFSIGGKKILLDAGPDTRYQMLKYDVENIDALFLSHPHEDHVGGLDDLRGFFYQSNCTKIPVFCSENTYEIIACRFGYLLERFSFHKLNERSGKFLVGGKEFSYFSYEQGTVPVLGFRYNKMAYLTDIKCYEESIFSFLEGVETLIVSALNFSGSHMHFSIDEAAAFGLKAQAKKTFLIHMNHEVEHEAVNKSLPVGVELATDGRIIDV